MVKNMLFSDSGLFTLPSLVGKGGQGWNGEIMDRLSLMTFELAGKGGRERFR